LLYMAYTNKKTELLYGTVKGLAAKSR